MSPWVGIRRPVEGSRELFFCLEFPQGIFFFSFGDVTALVSDGEESVYLLGFI